HIILVERKSGGKWECGVGRRDRGRHRAGRVTGARESRATPALRFERVDGARLVVAAAGLRDVVLPPRGAAARARIDEVEGQRRVDLDVRMKTTRRLPRAEADAG